MRQYRTGLFTARATCNMCYLPAECRISLGTLVPDVTIQLVAAGGCCWQKEAWTW